MITGSATSLAEQGFIQRTILSQPQVERELTDWHIPPFGAVRSEVARSAQWNEVFTLVILWLKVCMMYGQCHLPY
jgi:hypothetical protein